MVSGQIQVKIYTKIKSDTKIQVHSYIREIFVDSRFSDFFFREICRGLDKCFPGIRINNPFMLK